MISEKYGVSKQSLIKVGEFSVLWSLFEQRYFHSKADINEIEVFSSRVIIDALLQTKIINLQLSARDYLGVVDMDVVKDRVFSMDNPGSASHREAIFQYLSLSNQINLFGCLLFIYRIRNNFFHGLKDISRLDDQKDLFGNINEILSYMIDSVKFESVVAIKREN